MEFELEGRGFKSHLELGFSCELMSFLHVILIIFYYTTVFYMTIWLTFQYCKLDRTKGQGNTFAIRRFRYFYRDGEYRSFYQGIRYTEVCSIVFPLHIPLYSILQSY